MTKPIVEEFIETMDIVVEPAVVVVIGVVAIIANLIEAKEDKKALMIVEAMEE